MTDPHTTSQLAKLEIGAQRLYRYDRILDDAANLFDNDPLEWSKLPVLLQDRSGQYRDFRAQYRLAVAAGVVADDRGPNSTTEGTPSW